MISDLYSAIQGDGHYAPPVRLCLHCVSIGLPLLTCCILKGRANDSLGICGPYRHDSPGMPFFVTVSLFILLQLTYKLPFTQCLHLWNLHIATIQPEIKRTVQIEQESASHTATTTSALVTGGRSGLMQVSRYGACKLACHPGCIKEMCCT
jgi:hypothetical protein